MLTIYSETEYNAPSQGATKSYATLVHSICRALAPSLVKGIQAHSFEGQVCVETEISVLVACTFLPSSDKTRIMLF